MTTNLFKSIYRKAFILVLLLFSSSSSLWAQTSVKYDFSEQNGIEGPTIYYIKLVDSDSGDPITDSEGKPTVAVIYNGLPGDDDDDEEIETEHTGKYEGDIEIPETVEHTEDGDQESTTYTVTGIYDDAFKQCYNLTSVTIPSTITSIGTKAFYHSTGLVSLTMAIDEDGNSESCAVASIGDQTFEGCAALTTAEIFTSNLESIGSQAFQDCTKLGYIDEDNSDLSLDLSGITGENLADKAFLNCGNITSVILSDNLTKIQLRTFEGCSNLASVTTSKNNTSIGLPSSLETIEYQAFENCKKLAGTLDFSTTAVTSIAQKAFHNCELITSVSNFPLNVSYVASNVTHNSIAYQLFMGCTGLVTFTFNSASSTLTAIDHQAFSGCTELSSFPDIPSTVETIDYQAFQYCESLTSIELNEGLKTIGYNAFDGCKTITEITLPSTVTSIGDYAFQNCTYLTDIDYKAKECTSFGDGVFSGCGSNPDQLVTLTIDEPVQKIPQKLGDITALGTVNYKPTYNGVTIIDSEGEGTVVADLEQSIFAGCNDFDACAYFTTLTIGTGVVSLDKYMFKNCAHIADVTYSATNCTTNSESNSEPPFYGCNAISKITISDGVTQIPDLLFCAKQSGNFASLTTNAITIPASVTSIGKRSFQYCKHLTELDIKGNTEGNGTTVGGHAFQYAEALSTLTLGEGITVIGVDNDNNNEDEAGDAFADCIALTSVTLPKTLTTIGPQAFYGCTKLSTLTFQSNADSKLATIGNAAFFACKSLTSVVFPTSVTTIGNQAFQNCGKLSTVTIPGSSSDGGTSIGHDAFSRTFVSYPDGKEDGAGDMTLTIGENVTSIGASAFWNNGNLKTIIYNAPNCTLADSNDGNDIDSDGSGKNQTDDSPIFDTCPNVGTITIGENVTEIPDYLFSAFDNGESDEERKPEQNHFSGLEKFTIPSTVTKIGKNAFYGCSALTELTIDEKVDEIGEKAFARCNALTTVFENRTLAQLRGDYNTENENAPDLPTAGTDCFTKIAYTNLSESKTENCFLVVPENAARFYTAYVSNTNSTENQGYVGYGAIKPSADGWKSIPYLREDQVTIQITTNEGYVTHYSPYSYTLGEDNDDLKFGVITGVKDEDTGEFEITWNENGDNTVPAGSAILIKGPQGMANEVTYINKTMNTTDPYYTTTDNNYSKGYVYDPTSESIMFGTVDPNYNDWTNYAGQGKTDVPTDESYSASNYAFYKLSYYTNDYGVKELGFYMQDEYGTPFIITGDADKKYDSGVNLAWLAIYTGTQDPVRAFYPLNDNTTGIQNIELTDPESVQSDADGTSKDVIYNLQGMKIKQITRKGIYIINGKKVMR